LRSLLGSRIRWLLVAATLYTFFPVYTFAQTENGMVLIPSGKLIISTEHGTTEIRIDKFFMDRFEVTQEFYEKITGKNLSFLKITNDLLKKLTGLKQWNIVGVLESVCPLNGNGNGLLVRE